MTQDITGRGGPEVDVWRRMDFEPSDQVTASDAEVQFNPISPSQNLLKLDPGPSCHVAGPVLLLALPSLF
jgi:hypothetical protein